MSRINVTGAMLAEARKRRGQEVAARKRWLASPMIRTQMAGEPRYAHRLPEHNAAAHLAKRACQYAANILQRRGLLPADCRDLDAQWLPDSETVVFIRADATQAEVARYKIPEHIMRYDPTRAPMALELLARDPEKRCESTPELCLASLQAEVASAPMSKAQARMLARCQAAKVTRDRLSAALATAEQTRGRNSREARRLRSEFSIQQRVAANFSKFIATKYGRIVTR